MQFNANSIHLYCTAPCDPCELHRFILPEGLTALENMCCKTSVKLEAAYMWLRLQIISFLADADPPIPEAAAAKVLETGRETFKINRARYVPS